MDPKNQIYSGRVVRKHERGSGQQGKKGQGWIGMVVENRRKEGRTAVYSKHHNLTQKWQPETISPFAKQYKRDKPKKTKTSFWFKTMFCKKNEAGFLQVNNTDQARVHRPWSANWMMLHLPLLPVA